MSKTFVVIGGGAAGFFCAINAARLSPELTVVILEKTPKLLSKVKVSGGGRCNVTHNCQSVSDLLKNYPRGQNFLKKAFSHFSATDTVNWFEERGVSLKVEADGRMFPVSDSSQTIIDCFLEEAKKYGVKIYSQWNVHSLSKLDIGFEIISDKGQAIQADLICIACGGFPKKEQFDWITGLGHSIESPVPSLFTFNIPKNPITELMGISLPLATVKVAGSKLVESAPLLITHWGMSGPAVLRLSSWGARVLSEKGYQFTGLVHWVPEMNEEMIRAEIQKIRFSSPTQKIQNATLFRLPQRLWQFLIDRAGITEDLRWTDLPSKEQNRLIKVLTNDEYPVNGKTTFKEEFVTCGGIKLNEVDPTTMESRIIPNLFFAGEILDIDGITGGFNFQHAWTSGWLAAKTVTNRL
ncbi:NAD(P)/FAD-dependent oxidoreductase [Cytophagaceae bacterium DM2B3-1]|uniref:NAD(P)/FAD-dependent oxidoreductase n=1 Tax=Xanthocytophaga flava TaxID=3048013 RepID=A0ABT7CPC6_9BACT|nr:NAD(P)/FAD-dependent oxidoreductase [Xanthocytophaga flavus]MDJ1495601.1 NAD(P)/FAD-dependent oxidoreductase [Xanthocytophaga flavus]